MMQEVDSVTTQQALGYISSALSVLIMWILNLFRGSIKDLKNADEKLQEASKRQFEEVSKIRELVAGNYITRQEHEKMTDAIFRKLDKIEDIVRDKADKP